MGAEVDVEGLAAAAEAKPRRSQNVARSRRRRRRPNIEGPRHKIEVVFSAEEWGKVQQFAAEANCTVPWYLVQAAVDPASSAPAKGPWLSWARRREIVAALLSAASAMDMMRLHHVSKIGSNLNQLTHAAHVTGTVGEELAEVLEELTAVTEELRERAASLEELAQKAARR